MALDENFQSKIIKKNGITKVELQCWVELKEQLNAVDYKREICNFTKTVKKKVFELKHNFKDNYDYFIDVDIRDSPSTTAFLSVELSIIKDNSINSLKEYPDTLKKLISDYPIFKVFKNINKKKR
jgi:hypothetical protein